MITAIPAASVQAGAAHRWQPPGRRRTPAGPAAWSQWCATSCADVWRPVRSGTPEVIAAPLAISAPTGLPPPLLRKVMAAAAATAGHVSRSEPGAKIQAGRHVRPPARFQFPVGDHPPDMRVSGAAVTARSIGGHRHRVVEARLPGSEPGPGIRPKVIAVRTVELRSDLSARVPPAPPPTSGRRCPPRSIDGGCTTAGALDSVTGRSPRLTACITGGAE